MILKFIYSILYFFVIIFLLPFQYLKRPENIKSRWLREKFGKFDSEINTSGSKLIWIHAVSVGEVTAAIPFLKELKRKFPHLNLLVSTITDTGQKIALERVPAQTRVIYLPFDISFVLKKTIRHFRPKLFITMETELWPNLLRELNNNGVSAIILNGRISDNSFKGYKKISFFLKDFFSYIDLFGMQDDVYAQRIGELGAPQDRIKVIGNFKFDIRPSEKMLKWTQAIGSPLIIAGSTHRGEEKLMISVFSRLKKDFPDLNLIIAPRHPERFKEVEELIKSSNIAYTKRSELQDSDSTAKSIKGHIIILDAIGELASAYRIADIAVMGGSFIEHGGQNLLEAAYWAKPIICGPHMENFPFVEEFYRNNAAVEANDATLFQELKLLLESSEKREVIGKKAKELFDEKSGSVEKAIAEIEKYL